MIYLVDGTNNNKVVGKFDSLIDAKDYVSKKEHTEDWEANWNTFKDYADNFFTITQDEMTAAMVVKGSRVKDYWT